MPIPVMILIWLELGAMISFVLLGIRLLESGRAVFGCVWLFMSIGPMICLLIATLKGPDGKRW